jgi:signal transduction histidine kinase
LLVDDPMTLRLRLFLLVAGLVAAVLAAQLLLVRSLAARLDRDVHAVAVSVGEEILSGFFFVSGGSGAAPPPDGAAAGQERPGAAWLHRERVEIVTAAPGQPAPGAFEAKLFVAGEAIQIPAGAGGSERAAAAGRPARPRVVPDGHGALLVRGPRIERRIVLPSAPLASTLDRFSRELTVGSLALLVLGLAAAALVAQRATRPLDRLAAAAERVGGGELGATVPLDAPPGAADEIGAALAAFNAMSERLAALDRENRRLAESEQLSELAEVARGLAHTLRNPLNALGLAVEELAETTDRARAGDLVERSRRQIRRIDASLRSFLALASAPDAAAAEPVELGALARETALEALHDAASGVRIEVEAPQPVEIAGVAAEVKAVVQALLVNACEASPAGGQVVVRVAREGARGARIEIDDEGAGVAPEIAERLFAPHVTTKPHGSGMGLYLAARLATLRYGGGVALAARAPRGTRATLRLADRTPAAA